MRDGVGDGVFVGAHFCARKSGFDDRWPREAEMRGGGKKAQNM